MLPILMRIVTDNFERDMRRQEINMKVFRAKSSRCTPLVIAIEPKVVQKPSISGSYD